MAKMRKGVRVSGTKRLIAGGALIATGAGIIPGAFLVASGAKARAQTKAGLRDTTRLGRFKRSNGGNFIRPSVPKPSGGRGRKTGTARRGAGMSRSQAASVAAKARWGRR